ncbi:hypothetical protein [Shewanella sp. HN-41]|nr:hypothetical protein [Shewanella sp. HN-41]EGM71610.1 hypothetical protein SOHN41_00526 [Shewanella sp. HN-41]
MATAAATEKQRGGVLKGTAIASGAAAMTDNDKSAAALRVPSLDW